MMSDSVDLKKVEIMYQTLRKAEWQNDRTGEFDDKKWWNALNDTCLKRPRKRWKEIEI